MNKIVSSKITNIAKKCILLCVCLIIGFLLELCIAQHTYDSTDDKEELQSFTIKDCLLNGLHTEQHGICLVSDNDDPQLFMDISERYVNEIRVSLLEPVGKNWDIQLFYSDDLSGFSEADSITISVDTQQTSVSIPLNVNVSNIRMDLGSEAGTAFFVDEIIIKSEREKTSYVEKYSIPTAVFIGIVIWCIIELIWLFIRQYQCEKINETHMDICFWLILIITLTIAALAWLIFNGNRAESYTDLVYAILPATGANKSSERTVVYVLSMLGILTCSVYFFSKKRFLENRIINNEEKDDIVNNMILFSLLGIVSVLFMIYSQVSNIVVISAILITYLSFKCRNKAIDLVCLYFLVAYGLLGLYNVYAFGGGRISSDATIVYTLAAVLVIMLDAFNASKKTITRYLMITQLVVPLDLLLLVRNQYYKNGLYVTIDVPKRIQFVIYVLIIISISFVIFLLFQNREKITIGTLLSVFFVNAYNESGAIMSEDLHHPFENIIGYFQIFERGHVPYKEYIPTSGLYSVIQGAFFRFFGKGLFSNYNAAYGMYLLFVIFLVVLTASLHIDRKSILLAGIIFCPFSYTRVHLIIPIVLLLSYPRLIERRNLWLQTYILSSFINGLYYPLYGAAVCLGFLPLALIQVRRLVKSDEIKHIIKNVKFYISWTLCLLPIFLSMNLLWGTFVHIRNMSEQTIYADGMARFSQYIPDGYLTYLNNYPGFRMAVFLTISFVGPALLITIIYSLALLCGNISYMHKRVEIKNIELFCCVFSLVIILLISYSYTLVRLEIGNYFNRNVFIYNVVGLLLFVFVGQIGNKQIKKIMVCVAVMLPAISGTLALNNFAHQMQAYYTVPEKYVFVQDDRLQRWGNGFVLKSNYISVEDAYDKIEGISDKYMHFGTMPSFGYYYLCDVDAIGSMEYGLTVKSYDATKEAIAILENNPCAVGAMGDEFTSNNAFYNYYLYNWLLTSGKYIWSKENNVFLPNVKKVPVDRVDEINKEIEVIPDEFNIGMNANSVGRSYKSLKNRFKVSNISYNVEEKESLYEIRFENMIDGKEIDYLYLEFMGVDKIPYFCNYNEKVGNAKSFLEQSLLSKRYNEGLQVYIEWQDENDKEHRLYADVNDGKLLIPLGSGKKWLLNKHDGIKIAIRKNGTEVPNYKIGDIQFLQLKGIQ